MKRNAPSIASAFDFSSKTAYPPTTSLASVKGPSIRGYLPPRKPDARAHRSWSQPAAIDQRAGFDRLFAKLRHRVHEFLGRRAREVFSVLDQHHESHRRISF